eukprot:s109_g55.t1
MNRSFGPILLSHTVSPKKNWGNCVSWIARYLAISQVMSAEEVTIEFEVMAHTRLGQWVSVVGSTPELGGWNPTKAPALATASLYPKWIGKITCARVGSAKRRTCLPGGHPFWAVPTQPAAFVAELRQRLGIPDSATDTWCPQCNAVLHAHSHHAGICSTGGERTLRHNAIRNVVYTWIDRAGLNPEKERPGLLLPHAGLKTSTLPSGAQPISLYLAWKILEGTPTALDFAVTGPESLPQAMHKPVRAAAACAGLKATHQDTGRLCSEQGIHFQPVVVETIGAWGKTASHVLHIVAATVAAREGAAVADLHSRLLQELSTTTRRFRAQAALR